MKKPRVKINREVGQWSARWAHNPEVGGSNPPLATILISGVSFFMFGFHSD